jgi:hypothetical protein
MVTFLYQPKIALKAGIVAGAEVVGVSPTRNSVS